MQYTKYSTNTFYKDQISNLPCESQRPIQMKGNVVDLPAVAFLMKQFLIGLDIPEPPGSVETVRKFRNKH